MRLAAGTAAGAAFEHRRAFRTQWVQVPSRRLAGCSGSCLDGEPSTDASTRRRTRSSRCPLGEREMRGRPTASWRSGTQGSGAEDRDFPAPTANRRGDGQMQLVDSARDVFGRCRASRRWAERAMSNHACHAHALPVKPGEPGKGENRDGMVRVRVGVRVTLLVTSLQHTSR